jgi:hypothetical protein
MTEPLGSIPSKDDYILTLPTRMQRCQYLISKLKKLREMMDLAELQKDPTAISQT